MLIFSKTMSELSFCLTLRLPVLCRMSITRRPDYWWIIVHLTWPHSCRDWSSLGGSCTDRYLRTAYNSNLPGSRSHLVWSVAKARTGSITIRRWRREWPFHQEGISRLSINHDRHQYMGGIPRDWVHIGCPKSPDPPPISMNISNITYIYILSDNMSSVHYNCKTKVKPHSSNVLIIVNLPVASSFDVVSPSSMKSNRDSLSNISLSRDEATKTSPLSYRQGSMILICPARLSKDGS
jgi:hypothetical protein